MDISTKYMGLRLRNPLVVSASPLSEDLDTIRRMEDAGAGAVVFHSLFEEQISIQSEEVDRFLTEGTERYAESLTYFPNIEESFKLAPDEYVEHMRRAKEAVSIPLLGSLNGVSPGGWIRYAKLIEEAGADGLELNVYYIPTSPELSAAQVEDSTVELVREVVSGVTIPVAVKLSPFYSALPHLARRLDQVGARGLVLFNRFYQPDMNVDTLDVAPELTLSDSSELLLRLRWVAILFGKIKADMAVTGGVHTVEDTVKALLAGSRVAMMTSALLLRGLGHLRVLVKGLSSWMEGRYESVEQMQGLVSQRAVLEPAAFERANYMKVLRSFHPPVQPTPFQR